MTAKQVSCRNRRCARRVGIGLRGILGLSALGLVLYVGDQQAEPSRVQAQVSSDRSIWDGVYTREQAEKGAYAFGGCEICHGIDRFSGPGYIDTWSDNSLGDFFDFLRSAMPRNVHEPLDYQIYADLLAFFLASNQVPEGDQPLPPDIDVLRGIRITPRPSPGN
jgi:hypothetical protein